MKLKKYIILPYIACLLMTFPGCKQTESYTKQDVQKQLKEILETQSLDSRQRYEIVMQMATSLYNEKDYQGVVLFLTDWVEAHPDDIYNANWLLFTANCYMEMKAEPIAEYYFDKILQKYPDILIKGKSAHFICLQNLIQISTIPSHRIKYFNELISRYPNDVNTTELYFRLAKEYEQDNQWEQVLKTYKLFLQQPDASKIQIAGEPDAYKNAKRLVDFSRSSKDWTFESLSDLENSIKKALKNKDWDRLDRIRAKINFFTMSWKQDENEGIKENFSIATWNMGTDSEIKFNTRLDESSSPNEAYLRTWGWTGSVPIWYFYFRKVDFPINPDINGNWEWAGIYIGNKL